MATTLGFYRPKSFFSLVLVGFCLATLPLAIALVNGVFHVDRLFVQSEYAVHRAAQAAQVSRALVDQITEMERNARQYRVLEDKTLLENYIDRHEQFLETAQQLTVLAEGGLLTEAEGSTEGGSLITQIKVLIEKEDALFQFFRNAKKEKGKVVDPEKAFIELTQLGQIIVQHSQVWINEQVKSLSTMADKTKHLLIWQAAALVPGTIVFAIFLSVMISRPIRQIDAAIRQLGHGTFDEDISVKGNRDLQHLGERLNWLRRRLTELEEKKGNFMRHVSHELKTPLTAIREGSALMAEGLLGQLNSKQKEVSLLLQRNCLLLQRMIENLLNFNMVQAKKTTLELDNIRLDELVADVAADHKIALLAKRIDLRLQCQRASLRGDREKLRIVVDNLLSNAVKYSPDDSRLDVFLKKNKSMLVLDVADSGPGVDPGDREKVFEIFYRGRSTPNGDIRGSGLGLSIAKEFVQIHHGTIEVVEGREKGAHFRVTLPMYLDKAVA